jgi:hypothetical protein
MSEQRRWYAGVDWASESHHVFLTDDEGRKIGERAFKHGGCQRQLNTSQNPTV